MAVVNNDHINSDGRIMPPSGFTQRATIDCDRDEIYVLSVSPLFFEFFVSYVFNILCAESQQRKGTT